MQHAKQPSQPSLPSEGPQTEALLLAPKPPLALAVLPYTAAVRRMTHVSATVTSAPSRALYGEPLQPQSAMPGSPVLLLPLVPPPLPLLLLLPSRAAVPPTANLCVREARA